MKYINIWNRYWLSLNKGITLDVIDNLVMPNASDVWQWSYISQCINIQEVINNPLREWFPPNLLWNDGMTEEIKLQFGLTGEIPMTCKILTTIPDIYKFYNLQIPFLPGLILGSKSISSYLDLQILL